MTEKTGKRTAHSKMAKTTTGVKSHASESMEKNRTHPGRKSPLEGSRRLRDQAYRRHAIKAALFWADKAVSLSGTSMQTL